MFKKLAARVQLLFCLLNLFFYVLVAVASLDLEVLNVLLCKLMSFLREKGVYPVPTILLLTVVTMEMAYLELNSSASFPSPNR